MPFTDLRSMQSKDQTISCSESLVYQAIHMRMTGEHALLILMLLFRSLHAYLSAVDEPRHIYLMEDLHYERALWRKNGPRNCSACPNFQQLVQPVPKIFRSVEKKINHIFLRLLTTWPHLQRDVENACCYDWITLVFVTTGNIILFYLAWYEFYFTGF